MYSAVALGVNSDTPEHRFHLLRGFILEPSDKVSHSLIAIHSLSNGPLFTVLRHKNRLKRAEKGMGDMMAVVVGCGDGADAGIRVGRFGGF